LCSDNVFLKKALNYPMCLIRVNKVITCLDKFKATTAIITEKHFNKHHTSIFTTQYLLHGHTASILYRAFKINK